jgi:SAM-dependent methyltransferase
MNAVPHGSSQDSALTAELETLGACPVCRGQPRTLLYSDLQDIVARVAPGAWKLFRCDACDCRYLDPRPTRATFAAAFAGRRPPRAPDDASLLDPRTLARRARNDFLASRFGYRLPNREPFGRYVARAAPPRRRRYEHLVRDLAAPEPGARLLDVGSGNGEFLLRMRELGFSVAAHELDPEAARLVRSFGIEVTEGALAPDAFRCRFDAITLYHVLERSHDPVELLAACRALLAPGGTLWIATPNTESLGNRRFGKHWLHLDCPRHLCLFSPRALDAALERAGFARRSVRADIGRYGSLAAAAAMARRTRGQRAPGPLAARLLSALGDLVMLLQPALGDDLVATAEP